MRSVCVGGDFVTIIACAETCEAFSTGRYSDTASPSFSVLDNYILHIFACFLLLLLLLFFYFNSFIDTVFTYL